MKSSTPNIAILIIVIVLLAAGAGIYLGKQKTASEKLDREDSEQVNSKTPTLAANAEVSSSDSADFDLKTDTASAAPAASLPPLDNYVYYGAKILKRTSSRIEMESNSNSSEITDWYKELIKSSNFNARSFTQTSTNGTILNKLSAAKPGEKLDITIKKDQNTSIVTIVVDRS